MNIELTHPHTVKTTKQMKMFSSRIKGVDLNLNQNQIDDAVDGKI